MNGLKITCCVFSLLVVLWPIITEGQTPRKYNLLQLSPKQVRTVLKTMKPTRFESLLDPLLVPRVPGTKGNAAVREFISKKLKNLGWDIRYDSFSDRTPYGTVSFTNIVATLDPLAARRVVVACHYDSKLNREKTFVLATDSAVPCAMMLNLAEDLVEPLNNSRGNSRITLQFIFFDGEEAFKQWSAADSLYGARHLANLWQRTRSAQFSLNTIDAFILLDLLGAPNPTFYNYFEETSELYKRLVAIEERLHKMGKLRNHKSAHQYFNPNPMRAGIEDDHIPFYRRGVPILHLITIPFPAVWHQEKDNKENLDFAVIENLNKIFWTFIVEYLRLMRDDGS